MFGNKITLGIVGDRKTKNMKNKNIRNIIVGLVLAAIIITGAWIYIRNTPLGLVKQYYSALEHRDEKTFNKLADGGITFNEALRGALNGSGFSKNDDVKFKVNLIRQEKHGNSIWLYFKLDIYDNERSVEFERLLIVKPHRFGTLQITEPG
jgi:hypothetical protein